MLRVEPNPNEIQLQHDIEREFYEKYLPRVLYYKRDKVTHSNLDVDVDDVISEPVVLNVNWDSNKKLKELRNGFYVETKKIELRFHREQVEDAGVTMKQGDVIEFDLSKLKVDAETQDPSNNDLEEYLRKEIDGEDRNLYEVLQVEPTGRIRNTSEKLFLTVTIDLEHTWSS